MSIQISDRILNIKQSATASMSSKIQELKDKGEKILSLNVGESGFNTHDLVKEAGIKAIQENFTRYTTVDGYKTLKQAIINRYQIDHNIEYNLDEVCVTTGAKHSLHNIFNCIINEGDEIVYMAPYWGSYPDMIKLSGGIPIVLDTDIKNSFEPDIKKLEKLITIKTKAILLNIPNNPSGAIYSQQTMASIAKLMDKYPNILLISDEIYDQIYWEQSPITITQISPHLKERIIVASGISKNYAMTGWRIGYILAPKKLIEAVKKFQSQSLSCACSISQIAAITALELSRDQLEYMIQAYYERVCYTVNTLKNIPNVKTFMPQGSFYVFLDIRDILQKMEISDEEFCLKFLEEKLVGVMHGSAFGSPGYIRISAATEMDVLKEAITHLKDFLLNI